MNNAIRPFLFAALIVLFGCVKEDMTIEINSDFSGTVKVERRASGQFAQMLLKSYSEEGDNSPETRKKKLAESLKQGYRGIEAWTDLEIELKDNQIYVSATGYSSDLRKFQEIQTNRNDKSESPSRKLAITEVDGKHKLTFTFINYTKENPRLKNVPKEKQREVLESQVKMLDGYLKGLELNTTIKLPAKAEKTVAFVSDESEVTAALKYKQIREMILKQQKTHEMSVEFASAKTSAEKMAQFKLDFEKAKESWAILKD